MKPHTGPVRGIFARSQQYFTQYSGDAARNNLVTLRRSVLVFLALLVVYGPIVYFFSYNSLLIASYLICGAALLPFLLFALLYGRKAAPSEKVMRWVCSLFMLLPLAFTACISIFPYPDYPSLFYPMVYILVCVLFLLPLWQTIVTLTLANVVFFALIFRFETPIAIQQDVPAAVTAWILGFFFLYLVTDLRFSEGERRMELERISTTDPLTLLPNRRWMAEELPLAYRRCQRSGLPVSVFMMDVDDFKIYNDSFGHLAGDNCLAALGQLLREFAAELGVYTARYGGEEFLFFLPGCGGEEGLEHAEELLKRVRALNLESACGCGPLTVSLGVATEMPSPEAGNYTTLIRKADAALYQAKAWGKNRVYAYTDEAVETTEA